MDQDEARARPSAERAEVARLLTGNESAAAQDRQVEDEPGDYADAAQPLTAQGVDDAISADLQDRLAALDRALARLDHGSYRPSVPARPPPPQAPLRAAPPPHAAPRGD